MVLGALIEGAAVFLCRLTSRALSESNAEHAQAIDSFVATSLVVAGNFIKAKYSLNSLIQSFRLFGRVLQSRAGHLA